jgi:hypothetical protein
VIEEWSASVVSDGSIPEGFEINTAPASGDKFVAQLEQIGAKLSRAGADANHKCGIHIHVDVRDFNFVERAKLCWLWAACEREFYSLVPKSRRGSRWCLPRTNEIYKAFGTPRSLSPAAAKASLLFLAADDSSRPNVWDHPYSNDDALFRRDLARWEVMQAGGKKVVLEKYRNSKVTTLKNKGTVAHAGRRYFAFNVQSMFDHGTVEIRLHEACTDTKQITRWGALLAAFVDAAKRARIEEIEAVSNGTRSPWEYIMSVCPEGDRACWVCERSHLQSNPTR